MRQEAIIIQIEGDTITATIECADACKGCKAASMCGSKESKTITLTAHGVPRKVGDHIMIELNRATGLRAVAIAYLIPVVILIALLLVLQAVGVSDATAGITCIGAIVVYYILIKIFRLGAGVSITILTDE